MDTTHIAYTAEDLISHKLQKAGLLVAKPKFDRDGADLLILMNVHEGTKFGRVQCKGRTLINSDSSNVDVFKSYVTDAFVLFLYINDGNESVPNLFCFLPNEIKETWRLKTFSDSSKDFYRLSFSKSTYRNIQSSRNLLSHSFDESKIQIIMELIKNSDTETEFKKMMDLIKRQNKLIELQKEQSELHIKKTKLERILGEIKRINEKRSLLDDHIKLLEKFIKVAEEQTDVEKS